MAAKITNAELMTVTEFTAVMGKAQAEREALMFTAYGKARRFALAGWGWAEMCGRCDGTQRTPYTWVFNGDCFGCTTGFKMDGLHYDTRAELDAAMRKWAMGRRRADLKMREEMARIAAEREAAAKVWATEYADLIAWCRTLTPDSVEEYTDNRIEWLDTRELVDAEVQEDEHLIRTEKLDNGQWWANIGRTERVEYFDSHGHPYSALITMVRNGETLDAEPAQKLTAHMARVATREATSRYAGTAGDKVTITGTVVFTKTTEPGQWGTSRMVIVEGTGDSAGITLKTFSNAASAWEVDKGDAVTVTATVAKLEERAGRKETQVKRPKFQVTEPAAA